MKRILFSLFLITTPVKGRALVNGRILILLSGNGIDIS